ncbi:tyrosine-type recombinase/integrase [Pandoraea oxalativorans]|uniref:tyrosine-type recombinase/integrase n=1 Tax=Pandoraea oxalativorans TaxID=573737 RepID=UPI001471A0FA|nr:tyrosine-type recombinase/integrase [Pandoraea oxalativorans]
MFAPHVADWADDPLGAFDTWLAGRRGRGAAAQHGLRASSATVYRAQWSAFVRHLARPPRTPLTQVGEADISRYLAGLTHENRAQRARIRTLIERVLEDVYRVQAGSGTPNPARRALLAPSLDWKAVRGNRPTPFLAAPALAHLWQSLCATPMVAQPFGQWKGARDVALVVAYLGAGLKVGDSLRLTVNCINVDASWINVTPDDSHYPYRAPLLPEARPVLARWLAVRREAGTLGALLFPGGLDGRPMHGVTALRAVRTVAACAAPAHAHAPRLSPQTLRNTYAATLLAQGETDLALCAALGFAEVLSASRLRAAWQAWQAQSATPASVSPGP